MWPHGTNRLQRRDTLDESMGSLVLVGNLASASMLEVQSFCRCIEDLDSFVDREQPTTKEVVPVGLTLVAFIMATVIQAILVFGFAELTAMEMAGVLSIFLVALFEGRATALVAHVSDLLLEMVGVWAVQADV